MNDNERIVELEAQVERLERDLAQSQELRRDAVAARDAQREQLRHLRHRRAVRIAVRAANRSGPVVAGVHKLVAFPRRAVRSVRRRIRSARQRIGDRARSRTLRATKGAEEALAAALLKALPGTRFVDGPLVSIVILNRDGREHLARCLGALASTAYRNVEIIVVDNGSTDGSPELAESFELPFPVRVIRNEVNRSFSEANGQAVEVAAGELICFLNNDVDPITDDWLGYMVETMTARQAVAVGARLIYPRHRGGVRAGKNHADLSIQHAGVSFDRSAPVPLGRVMARARIRSRPGCPRSRRGRH